MPYMTEPPPTLFRQEFPQADQLLLRCAWCKSVQIAGDFNQWHPVPMHQQVDGWWFIQLLLAHGHHHYHFLVDGQPTLDPHASGTARDDDNQPVSLVAVS